MQSRALARPSVDRQGRVIIQQVCSQVNAASARPARIIGRDRTLGLLAPEERYEQPEVIRP